MAVVAIVAAAIAAAADGDRGDATMMITRTRRVRSALDFATLTTMPSLSLAHDETALDS